MEPITNFYEIDRDLQHAVTADHRSIRLSHHNLPHFHDSVEFMYIAGGELDTTIEGVHRIVGAGNLIALAPFVPHENIGSDADTYMLVIPRRLVSNLDQLMGGSVFATPVIADPDGQLLQSILHIFALHNRDGIFEKIDPESASALELSEICTFIRLVIALCGLRENAVSSGIVPRAIEYIHLHFRETVSIPKLAQHLLCNQNILAARFKKTFGITLNEYVNRVRAAEVRRLLREHPDMNLAEAADLAGFGSLRTLHRVYRQEFGCTPRRP